MMMEFDIIKLGNKKCILKGLIKNIDMPTHLIIPDTVDNYDVEYLNLGVFKENPTIEKVTLGEHVKELSDQAFACCSALKEITLNKSLRVLKRSCLDQTAITTIDIPQGVEQIGNYALPNSLNTLYLRSPYIEISPLFLGLHHDKREPIKIHTIGFSFEELCNNQSVLSRTKNSEDRSTLRHYQDNIIPIECSLEGYPLFKFNSMNKEFNY